MIAPEGIKREPCPSLVHQATKEAMPSPTVSREDEELPEEDHMQKSDKEFIKSV